MQAKGNSNKEQKYQFLDQRPLGGKSLYRLQQADLDGKKKYSPIVTANCSEKPIKIFPNPANSMIKLENLKSNLYVSIYTIQGKWLRSYNLSQKNPRIILNEFPSGTYLLRWVDNGLTENRRFIIMR